MARRVVKSLSDMEIDEISLVDRGANQHAAVTIAKRAPEEDNMPDFYNEDGELLGEDQLAAGMTVFDADGAAYELAESEEAPTDDKAAERELASVGKRDGISSAFGTTKVSKKDDKSFAQMVQEELSKAYSDDDRDAIISKALGRVEELESRQAKAEEIAKSERDLRLTREYISKAATYNIPIASDELGPVLYRMAENMSYDDCAVINKALETAGAVIFEELGYQGGGANEPDIMQMVEASADEYIGKADGKVSKADLIEGLFDENPAAYDQYLAERQGR